MFCNKCGKPIESDDGYCTDCGPKEESVNTVTTDMSEVETESELESDVESDTDAEYSDEIEEQQEQDEPKKEGRVVDGLACAVACVILGIISYFFTYVAYMLITADGFVGAFTDEPTLAMTIIGIALIIIAMGIAVPSVILGVHSIRLYISAVTNNKVKPVPALVLGIYGAVMMALELLMVVTIVIMLVASILKRI